MSQALLFCEGSFRSLLTSRLGNQRPGKVWLDGWQAWPIKKKRLTLGNLGEVVNGMLIEGRGDQGYT